MNKQTDTTAIMLYSLKNETGHETPKEKMTNKKELWDNTHPLSPNHTILWISHPHLSHLPIIHNNNTLDKNLLIQMRESDKCPSVRNDEILNLHLSSSVGPKVSINCLLKDTSDIYWFHPTKRLTRKNERTQKRNYASNKSYRTALVYINRIQG